MNFQDYMFVVFLFIGISFTTVYGLQCYVCNPSNPGEEDCGTLKEGSTEYLQNCAAPNDQSCFKEDLWLELRHPNQTRTIVERTIRQCSSDPSDPANPCYVVIFGGKKTRCNCNTDGCNGTNKASRTGSTVFLIMSLMLVAGWIS